MHDLNKIAKSWENPILAPTAFAIRMNCQSHPYFIRIDWQFQPATPSLIPFHIKRFQENS
jgi:hypothetical protein